MRPTFIIPIFGTHGWERGSTAWWRPGSLLLNYLYGLNLIPLFPDRPFMWSGDLDGILFANGNDWEAGAEALKWMLDHPLAPIPMGARNLIAHSHGGQVALLAAASGVKLNRLITIGTPVRHELDKSYAAAALNIGKWLHVCDSEHDFISVLGAIGDHRFRVIRQNKHANINDDIHGISHSKVLTDPDYFHYWLDKGWAKLLSE